MKGLFQFQTRIKRDTRSGFLTVTAIILGFFLAGCSSEMAVTPKANYMNWKAYAGSPDGAQYSSLDQINLSNVLRLDIAWSNNTGDANRSEFV